MVLVILGPSKWPENVQLLPSLSSRNNIPEPQDATPGKPFRRGHVRTASRPFDVLYDDVQPDNKPPKLAGDLTAQYLTVTSPSYIQIENTLRAGETPLQATNKAAPPPTVTIIEEKGVHRSGSVISRLATLRRRHSKRHWMARRRDVIPKDPKTPELKIDGRKSSKIDFIFPIRRKTSFKYSPANSPKPSRFRSQNEVDAFFSLDGVADAVKGLLPFNMKSFEFEGLKRMEPILRVIPHIIDTSKGLTRNFSERGMKAPLNEPPLVAHNSTFNTVSSPSQALSIGSNERQLFLSSLYTKYRQTAFGRMQQIPEKIEVMFPFESDRLLQEEKERLNTVLLLDALLRRTVAAKVEFRLKQHNVHAFNSGSSRSSFSYSSSLNASGYHKPKDPFSAPNDFKTSSHKSSSSANTTLFNSSRGTAPRDSISDRLPSPQISGSSTALPLSRKSYLDEGKGFVSLADKQDIQKEAGANSQRTDSEKLPSANSTLDAHGNTPHTTLTSPMRANVSTSNSSDTASKLLKSAEISGVSQQSADMTLNTGIANLSLLRPLNFSSDTLSSSSTVPGTNCFEIYHFDDLPEGPAPEVLLKSSKLDPKNASKSLFTEWKAPLDPRELQPPDISSKLPYMSGTATPEVGATYFYPQFVKVSAPDAISKSLLPLEDVVLRRQQSMHTYRTPAANRNKRLPDTPSSSASSEFERRTIP
ncbi:hypothetical protein PUMCH_003224 [Australozyma saopauloensis]|uniref:Uncharacterized protein n=1 Tax=Australozyma saopauloensis TaxID=291208 RepID=A0AAX4HDV0_9ASCO|nr:hypothetical protein PUMCH_003224 [[Candida] saopauloensis]